MVGVDDVPRGVPVLGRGAQTLVGDDGVAHLQFRGLGELDVGGDADAHHAVGRKSGSVGELDAVGAGAVTGDALDGGVGPQDDPLIPVQVGEDLGRLPAEYFQQRQLGVLQDGHQRPGRPGRRGGLQGDPAAADDDHDPGPGGEGGLEPLAVSHAAQVQHVVHVRPGHRQSARGRSGRQKQPGVRHPASAGEFELAGVCVDVRHARSGHQVDVVLAVPVFGMHEYRLAGVLAEQVPLGQRRSDVGALRSSSMMTSGPS